MWKKCIASVRVNMTLCACEKCGVCVEGGTLTLTVADASDGGPPAASFGGLNLIDAYNIHLTNSKWSKVSIHTVNFKSIERANC